MIAVQYRIGRPFLFLCGGYRWSPWLTSLSLNESESGYPVEHMSLPGVYLFFISLFYSPASHGYVVMMFSPDGGT